MKYLLSDLRRSFFSIGFIVAIISIIIFYYLGNSSALNEPQMDVLDYFVNTKVFGKIGDIIVSLAVLPSAMSFVEDLHSNFIRSLIVREGILKYSLSKIISAILSSMAVVFISLGLFIILLRFKLPLVIRGGNNYNVYVESTAFGNFIDSGNYILYFFMQILLVAIVCSIFSLVALLVTTYIPNKFLGIAAPIIVYFIIKVSTEALNQIAILPIVSMLRGTKIMSLGNNFTIYILGFFIVVNTVLGILFYKGVKRNVYKG